MWEGKPAIYVRDGNYNIIRPVLRTSDKKSTSGRRGHVSLRFYLFNTVFTCAGQTDKLDNLKFPSLYVLPHAIGNMRSMDLSDDQTWAEGSRLRLRHPRLLGAWLRLRDFQRLQLRGLPKIQQIAWLGLHNQGFGFGF